MTLTHKRVLGTDTIQTIWGTMVREHTVTYRLHSKPLKQLNRWDLPASYELDSWENDEDSWVKIHGLIYNLKEFCTVGMPHLPGPNGGAQLASDGYILIAAFEGEVYSVSTEERKPI